MPDSASPRGEHRLLYVSDPSSIARRLLPDPTQEYHIRRWVDMVADSGVDLFEQEIFSQGWSAWWRSETTAYDQRFAHRRFLPLLDAGVQPLDILIDQSHARGMKFIGGFRVNDGHAYQARAQGLDIAEFIASNPQLQLTDLPAGELYAQTEPLDFSHAEVRNFTVAVIREVVEDFAVDGVELCFRDSAYFPVGTAAARAALMTDMIGTIHELLRDRARVVGRKLLFGARVPASFEECAALGLDLPTWIEGGLLDFVCPQDAMYADYNVPYGEWASLTRRTDCLLFPGMNPWPSTRARYRRKRLPLTHANARALAHTMYCSGADGVSIFNHFVPSIWTAPFYPQSMQMFHQLRDPARVANAERHYIFDPTYDGLDGFGGLGKCNTGATKIQQLRLDRSRAGATDAYQFQLYEDLHQAYGATLLFRGAGLTQDDELEIRLNGHLVADESIDRTAESDADPPGGEGDRQAGGAAIPCLAEQGWFDFRPEPGPVFSTRWFALAAAMLEQGVNRLTVKLTHSDPGARQGTIVIDEVEVWVEPKPGAQS